MFNKCLFFTTFPSNSKSLSCQIGSRRNSKSKIKRGRESSSEAGSTLKFGLFEAPLTVQMGIFTLLPPTTGAILLKSYESYEFLD